MNADRFSVVGWISIAGAVVIPPAMVLARIYDGDPASRAVLLPVIMVLGFSATALSLYALYRFRHLLNGRYGFHEIDSHVVMLIVGGVILTLIATFGRLFTPLGPEASVPFAMGVLGTGIPLSLLGIAFGSRLLRLQDGMGGFLRPLAYTQIVGSICFVTVVLAPVGFLLLSGGNVLLGLIFLREDRSAGAPGFVRSVSVAEAGDPGEVRI